MSIAYALLIAALVSLPLLVTRRPWRPVAGLFLGTAVICSLIVYGLKPTTAPPIWGFVGALTALGWVVTACVDGLLADRFTRMCWLPVAAGLLFIGRAGTGCSAFRAGEYADMIGMVEERAWTDDVQPADPERIRLVPDEMAMWLGNKQLGSASGAIGSQFQIEARGLTLQRIGDELWYVAPLEFRGWGAWRSAERSPGYVMISAEDPERLPIVKDKEKFLWTPGAYWNYDLRRHALAEGHRDGGLDDWSLEIDEAGKAWWVATTYRYEIAWWAKRVTGIVIVDPGTGDVTSYPVAGVPEWVDRVYPKEFVKEYVADWGRFRSGWLNSWLGQEDVREPEEPSLVYGSDGRPYWVTGITSTNSADEALVGLMYTDVRSGKSVFYKASGGTDTAVLQAVDNKVSFMKQHGSSPVVYNINGTMASVVPLLGESHTYQGVAIVDVARPQDVAIGKSFPQALREFRQLQSERGGNGPIGTDARVTSLSGTVERFAAETRNGNTSYLLKLEGHAKLFTAGGDISPHVPLTRPGDQVDLTYHPGEEAVTAALSFVNASLRADADPPPSAETPPSDAAP